MQVVGDQIGLTLDRIVLATDFSPVAEKAAGYAQGLAKHFASSLSVANVVDLSVTTRYADVIAETSVEEMRQISAENQGRLLCDLSVAGVRTTVYTMESHNPAEALVAFADGMRADLIVTGTNGRSGLKKAIVGSCSEGIIRHARCPVLTIGPKAKLAPKGPLSFHTILFATEFGADVAKKAEVTFNFAKENIAKVYLCHVIDTPGVDITDALSLKLKSETELERLIPDSAYDWCETEIIVEGGPVAEHILELAKRVKADLIVLGARHSITWFTHLIEGTVGKVLMNAECPVMTVSAG
jgi:nucleotide-binding universal stress UspA family protein